MKSVLALHSRVTSSRCRWNWWQAVMTAVLIRSHVGLTTVHFTTIQRRCSAAPCSRATRPANEVLARRRRRIGAACHVAYVTHVPSSRRPRLPVNYSCWSSITWAGKRKCTRTDANSQLLTHNMQYSKSHCSIVTRRCRLVFTLHVCTKSNIKQSQTYNRSPGFPRYPLVGLLVVVFE